MVKRMYKFLYLLIAVFSLVAGALFVWADTSQQELVDVMLNEEDHSFELNNALKTNPFDAESHVRLGRVYYENGLFDQTIYEFLKASEIDLRYTELYVKLTTLLGKENRISSELGVGSSETPYSQQIDVGGAISSVSAVLGENNPNLNVQAIIPDATSKINEDIGGNASNDTFTPKANLENVSQAIETLKTNTDCKKAKIAFNSKHLLLLKGVIDWVKNELFEQEEDKGPGSLQLFIINVLMFVSVGMVTYTVFSLLPGKANPTKDRLEQLRVSASARSRKKALSQVRRKEAHFLKERLYSLGQLIIPRSEEARSKMKMDLSRAGYRHSDAVSIYSGIKVLLALIFMGGFGVAGIAMKMKPGHLMFFSPAIAGLGMYLPILWLRFKTKKRKAAILSGFPDALDLLAVCVDAGLGLDAAIVRVADEIRLANRQMSEEFQLLNLEIRAGKPRTEALHNLGQRTDIEDIQSLVAMLIQSDKFGTSIAQSLRVHSDAARTKRRLKAEESAAKTTVKMVFPLLLFILPALFVIVMAPAVLQIIKNMGSK